MQSVHSASVNPACVNPAIGGFVATIVLVAAAASVACAGSATLSERFAADSRLLPASSMPVPPDVRFGSENAIDKFLAHAWEQVEVRPAPRCDDATFARRAYLDIAGVIPTAKQLENFLRDRAPNKRNKLIDKLLGSDRYAAHWGVFWEDLLRARARQRGTEPQSYREYIQATLRENKPYDVWVREMITAEGTTKDNPAANFVIRHMNDVNELTITTTQVFMGVQLKCVQCHDDRSGRFWKQSDFEQMAGFWRGTRARRAESEKITGPGGREIEIDYWKVVERDRRAEGVFLGGVTNDDVEVNKSNGGKGREALAALLTDPANPYFSRAVVNRVWAKLMGAGLVEPVDDLDPDNPASHPALLDWLAHDFINKQYDLQALVRLIMTSRAYQLSSTRFRHASPETDRRLFDAMPLQRMTAEQLWDSVLVATGLLDNGPRLRPAVELPAPPRPNHFLATFGSHDRESIHERDDEASIPQALELMNGELLNRAVGWHRDNPIRVWNAAGMSRRDAIDAVFMQTLSRKPTKGERATIAQYLNNGDGAEAWSDVLWALINTREFMFVR